MQLYKKMNSKEKFLALIFKNPTRKFHIREFARESKLNPNTVLSLINTFQSEGIIVLEKKRHITEFSANLDSQQYFTKKRIFNLSQLYDSGLVDFLEKNYSPETICVMGSYSRGEDIERSDIDLVLIGKNQKEFNLSKFEKFLSRKIHLILTDYKNMSKEFYNNLINGVVLSGYLEVK